MLKWIAKTVDSRGFITIFALTVVGGTAGAIYFMPSGDRTATSIAAVVQTAAVLVGLLSLILIGRQIRSSASQAAHAAATAKALAYHQFFGDLITVESREKLEHVADECGFKDARKSGKEMTDASVLCVKAVPAHDAMLACYLDEFEEFCGAIHAGLLDEDYSYSLEATRIIRTWKVFKPYVLATRTETDDHRTYVELERIADSWTARRVAEDARAAEDKKKVRQLLIDAQGVKKAIPSAVN